MELTHTHMTTTPQRSRSVRPDPATLKPLKLTGSRRRILELLHRYRYLTPRLLTLAYDAERARDAGLSSHIRQELKALWWHSLIDRHYQGKRPTGQGSDEYIYAISLTGGRCVLDRETYSRDRHKIFGRSQREQGNYDHHLALSSLQLILELGAAEWGVESFRADERTPASRFTVRLAGEHHTRQPDAWVTLALPSGQRPLYLFELDLVRKNNRLTSARFEAYATHLTGPGLPKMLAREDASYAAVVFIAPNEAEVERFLEAAAPIVGRWSRRDRPQFLFWNIEDWYEQQAMARREAVGTAAERTRQWTINALRSPRQILEALEVCDIHGKPRRLVEGH